MIEVIPQLLHHLPDIDRHSSPRGPDGGEEHGGRLEVVGEGRRRWRIAIEPVQELSRNRLVALPYDLVRRHFARL